MNHQATTRSQSTRAVPDFDRYWHGLFYALVAVATVLAFVDDGSDRAVVLAGAAMLSGLYWATIQRGGTPWNEPGIRTALYFLGMAVAFVYLTTQSQAYLALLWAVYPQAFAFLGFRVGAVVSVPITLLLSWREGLLEDLSSRPENLLVILGSVVIAVALGAFIWAIVRQGEEQQHIIEELEATRADLLELAAAKGALEERERLAREIHDTLAQGFTSVVMQLEAAEQELERGGNPRTHLDRARSIARHSLDAVRRSVSDLRPDLLDDGGLPEALRRTTARVAEHWAFDVDTVVTGDVQTMHPDGEVALLRVAQEALANVTKHATATRARVTLSYLDDEVTLDVRDDGVGFDSAAKRSVGTGAGSERCGGFGLATMAERVEAVGGQFTVESEPARGTAVMARVPMDLGAGGQP